MEEEKAKSETKTNKKDQYTGTRGNRKTGKGREKVRRLGEVREKSARGWHPLFHKRRSPLSTEVIRNCGHKRK